MSDFLMPTTEEEAEKPCDCCAQRALHIYRADCLRCIARDMARGVPRFERARREEMRKQHSAEWMTTLCRMVGEERKLDQAAGFYKREGHA